MGLQTIIAAAERVGECDERRQQAFLEEFEAYERGATESFSETRSALADERASLDQLADELEAERGNLEELTEYTEFLTAEQAVTHRDQGVAKLEAHNTHLHEFHDAMAEALDVVEQNLDTLVADGPEAVSADPEPAFERAHDALEAHNEAVDGLDTNLSILNAYLS